MEQFIFGLAKLGVITAVIPAGFFWINNHSKNKVKSELVYKRTSIFLVKKVVKKISNPRI
jgi:hypothetical protein